MPNIAEQTPRVERALLPSGRHRWYGDNGVNKPRHAAHVVRRTHYATCPPAPWTFAPAGVRWSVSLTLTPRARGGCWTRHLGKLDVTRALGTVRMQRGMYCSFLKTM